MHRNNAAQVKDYMHFTSYSLTRAHQDDFSDKYLHFPVSIIDGLLSGLCDKL